MIKRGVINAEDAITIYKSQTFPTTGFGTVYNLTPELHAAVQEAFFSFEWDGTALQEEFEKSIEGQFLHINYKDFWDVIRMRLAMCRTYLASHLPTYSKWHFHVTYRRPQKKMCSTISTNWTSRCCVIMLRVNERPDAFS